MYFSIFSLTLEFGNFSELIHLGIYKFAKLEIIFISSFSSSFFVFIFSFFKFINHFSNHFIRAEHCNPIVLADVFFILQEGLKIIFLDNQSPSNKELDIFSITQYSISLMPLNFCKSSLFVSSSNFTHLFSKVLVFSINLHHAIKKFKLFTSFFINSSTVFHSKFLTLFF
jgi:hypothetical protein